MESNHSQQVNRKLSQLTTLTLTGLSLFFKFLSFSNTGDSIAYTLATIHFLYLKLDSFSDMEYCFYHLAYLDSKVPKCFVGLNQMKCSPSFDWNYDLTACLYQLHPRFYSKGNASGTHQSAWAGLLKPQIVWAVRGLHPPPTLINGGTPLLKFPP